MLSKPAFVILTLKHIPLIRLMLRRSAPCRSNLKKVNRFGIATNSLQKR